MSTTPSPQGDARFLSCASVTTRDEKELLRFQFDLLLEHNHRRQIDFLSRGYGASLALAFVDTMTVGWTFSKPLLKSIFAVDMQVKYPTGLSAIFHKM